MSSAGLVAVIGIVVVSIVTTVVGIVALVWALRRAAQAREAELRQSYPDAELGPEPCQYRGGTGPYPRTRNTAFAVLTRSELVVRPLVGIEVVLPLTEISGTRVERSFNGHRNGRPVLVVEGARGEVGVSVGDLEGWRAALVRRTGCPI